MVANTFLKAVTFSSYGFFLKYLVERQSTSLRPIKTKDPKQQRSIIPLQYHFLSGLGSGFVNSLLSAPVDRAKIILQVQTNPVQSDTFSRNHLKKIIDRFSHTKIL